jgi:hypothetical protein
MFMFYHNLTIYRKPGSDSPPYYENPLVMHAINDSILPNPIGPLGNISRETKSGGKDPLEGPSKRAACALLNHYYRIDRNFLVSSEQERSHLVLGLSEKGRETGIKKPDFLVRKGWKRFSTSYSLLLHSRPIVAGGGRYLIETVLGPR